MSRAEDIAAAFMAELCAEPKFQIRQNLSAPEILTRAADEMANRAAVRDSPEGERSMRRAVAAYNSITGQGVTEVQGWLFMALLKASRGTGGGLHMDDWVDMAAYAALAGEAAGRGDEV